MKDYTREEVRLVNIANATVVSSNAKLRLHIRMVLSISVGWLGIDRFYDKQVGWGVIKMITLGGVGVWWLIDAAYYSYKAGETL